MATQDLFSLVVAQALRHAAALFLIVLMVAFTILEPRFLHPLNQLNVLRQVSIFGIIALGVTFVIITAGIDLSIGALMAFAALVGAYVAKGGMADRFAVGAAVDSGNPAFLAMLVAIIMGGLCGLVQGFAVTRLRVPPFVVTLGGLTIFRGAALLFSDGGPISGFEPDYVWWGQGRISNIPVPVIVFLTLAVVAHITLKHTRLGTHIYATGDNRSAADRNGVPTAKIMVLVYSITGLCCGLAGFLLSARLNSAEAVAGLGLELKVIAAVVIGGTSLFGGIGTIAGTVIGICLIGVLTNGLVLLNVSSFIQQIVIGLVLILAVAVDRDQKAER